MKFAVPTARLFLKSMNTSSEIEIAPPATPLGESPVAADWFWRRRYLLLAVILLTAACIRLPGLEYAPPGLNQDEAQNAWDAYCMLKTGHDQVGDSWPIFYSKCFGGNRSTLQLYYLLPFQAIGGLNVWTLRFSSAVAGVLAVWLVYVVAGRLFDHRVGLFAALLLALNPWHIQQSRWGHEASLVPLLVLLSAAMMFWAGFPLDDQSRRRPRPIIAALAGAVAGICCYGYQSARLFIPLFLLVTATVVWRSIWRQIRTRKGAAAILLFVTMFALTFGPLAWKHLTDDDINKRGRTTSVWKPYDDIITKVSKVLERYPVHYGPDFLFVHGDKNPLQSTPYAGAFHWYSLPLMLAGAVVVAGRLRRSPSARILLVWLVLYPIGDCITNDRAVHALRSLPGLPAFAMLEAVGAVGGGLWLWRRSRTVGLAAACALAVAALVLNFGFLLGYFADYPKQWPIRVWMQADLVEACKWLKPRLKDIDAVFCSAEVGTNQPYIITTVALGYDPKDWFEDEHLVFCPEPNKWTGFRAMTARQSKFEFDWHVRYGKMIFNYRDLWKPIYDKFVQDDRPCRIVRLVRPGQLGSRIPQGEIIGPDGRPSLWIYDVSK